MYNLFITLIISQNEKNLNRNENVKFLFHVKILQSYLIKCPALTALGIRKLTDNQYGHKKK